MNDAGRIGFVIRGDYNETEIYDFLDLVYFKGASYVAKKETMGNEPVHNNKYWHIFSTDVNTLQPSFTQSEFREDIQSGDFLHIIFGKIKRWFTDLKDVAFTGNYDDLNNTPTSLKNPNALNIKFNGTSQTNYDGSVAQEIDVTPSSISAVNTSTVLNTIEEIDANTSNSNVAGAQALKAVKDQINSNLPFAFGIDSSGNYGYIKAGADTVTPFKVFGTVTVRSGRQTQLEFATGHPGFNNFVANVNRLRFYTGEGHVQHYGFDVLTRYNKDTGVITLSVSTEGLPSVSSFQWGQDYTLKYVLWND